MKRLSLGIAVALLVLAPPASASVRHVFVGSGGVGGWAGDLCVDTDSTAPVTVTLSSPQGQQLATAAATPVLAGGAPAGCSPSDSAAGAIGFSLRWADLGNGFYPAGGRLTVDQSGVDLVIPLPYAAYQQSGAAPIDLHVRGLPLPAWVGVTGSPLENSAVATGSYDDNGLAVSDPADAVLTVVDPTTLSDSTGALVPMSARISLVRFALTVRGRSVSATGLDPLGGPAAVTLLAADGTPLDQVVLHPRIGERSSLSLGLFDLGASDAFDRLPPANAVAQLEQAGWFGQAVRAGAVTFRPDGFTATVPSASAGGGGGSASTDLAFTPLGGLCGPLGPALTCEAGNLFIVPGDTVTVTSSDLAGDSFTLTATAPGATGSLDDGSFRYYGAQPGQPGTLTLTSPVPGRAPYREDGDQVLADRDGVVDASDYFTAHLNDRSTLALKGPAFAGQTRPFQWNLEYSASAPSGGAVTLTGTTYPNGRLSFAIERGAPALVTPLGGTADANGRWSLTLPPDVQPGDTVAITAADPATHATTTSTYRVGQVFPAIGGVLDQDAVRGTIRPRVTAAGVQRVAWGGDFAPFSTSTAPFTDAIDTRLYPDGVYRLEATTLVPSPATTNYLYLTVDNTPPVGSAGPPQTVAPGRRVVFVTGADDDTSGLASVDLRFGDGHGARRTGAAAGLPITHVYARSGRYVARITIRDRAGNVRTARTTIRVTTALSAQVSGTIPGTVRRGRSLVARLRAVAPGDLTFQVLGGRGQTLVRATEHFSRSGQRLLVRFPTGRLARGRYLVVLQFDPDSSAAGPVVTRRLDVR